MQMTGKNSCTGMGGKVLIKTAIPIHPMISPICEGEIMSRNSSHFKWLPADDEDDAKLFLSIEDKLILNDNPQKQLTMQKCRECRKRS